MKIMILDHYEFECISSEQYLVIAIAKSNQFHNLEAFYSATAETDHFVSGQFPFQTEGIAFQDYEYSSSVSYNLEQFLGRGPGAQSRVIEVIDSEWNGQEILIEEKGTFIRYAWETSA
ncbi:hypothetical protein [Gimesia fumaroli]|uniref:Uncharacterized protein n=1 Tax=Gimesia fumaroli TaxID=2527976 RepID=A0A518I7J9_9PLAN|nr:hypothetical protein [Gimesia fumaroli]QDV49024.1 hypothetical protein Enr17x_10390 [Gimesia fumaroli]